MKKMKMSPDYIYKYACIIKMWKKVNLKTFFDGQIYWISARFAQESLEKHFNILEI